MAWNVALAVVVCVAVSGVASRSFADDSPALSRTDPYPQAVYSPNPEHIWNRVFCHLYERPSNDGTNRCAYDGLHAWPRTARLFHGPPHAQAVELLDELVSSNQGQPVLEPWKRAVFQNDLWTIFEGSLARRWRSGHQTERVELHRALVRGMQRVALSRRQIESLEDNYLATVAARAYATEYDPSYPERPFLPSDLWDTEGPWVLVSSTTGDVAATLHVRESHAPSIFFVFLNLPGGRKVTSHYLQRLNHASVEAPYEIEALPALPPGTMVALARTMFLVSDTGHLYPTRIAQSVQIRVYRDSGTAGPQAKGTRRRIPRRQDFYMFELDRKAFSSGSPVSLVPVSGDGLMPIEVEVGTEDTLDSCPACHDQPGLLSLQTYSRALATGETLPRLVEGARGHEEYVVGRWKKQDFSWGYLMGIWQSQAGR